MVSYALQLNPDYDVHIPTPSRRNPFLEALRDVDYGHLTVITHYGDRMEFAGRSEGPVATIKVKDLSVFDELIARGEIGFAEAYMDGRWDSPDVAALLTFAMVNSYSLERFFHGRPLYAMWIKLKSALMENSLQGSKRNIKKHYDLGNEFYSLWLDKSMTYSCALFQGDHKRTLAQAQQAKYARILDKLAAKPGDHILEIGCGWGGFATAAAQRGIAVTGLTISERQAELAKRNLDKLGLSGLAKIELCDYREAEGLYDHVVSIGMFEHVGQKFWPDYFRAIKKHLKPGGKAMVQSITLDSHLFETLHDVVGFIETYIFPGGMLPSKFRFEEAALKEGMACKEIFAFGEDYATTLEHWLASFEARRDDVIKLGYDERFIRMWRYYLAASMASFNARRTDVMQVELTHQS